MTDWAAGMDITSARLVASTLGDKKSWVPAFGSAGTIAYSNQAGWYFELGPIVFFSAYLVVTSAGTGSSGITMNAPTNIDRSTRQVVSGLALGTSSRNGSWMIQSNTTGSGSTFDRINGSSGTQIIGSDIDSTAIIAIEGFYLSA